MRAHYGAESKVNDGGFARSTQGFGNRIHTLKHEFAHGFGHGCEHEFKAGIVAKLLEALSAFAHVCKRRIPTVIAVVLLLAVWEAWVRIGNVPSTMIAAPSEIAQATVETWSTLWPATQVTLLEGAVSSVRRTVRHSHRHTAVLLMHCERRIVPVAFSCADHAVDFHRSPIFDLVWL